ncbi:MAG: glutamate synthase central domain-containing protein, partial [Aggregatilineales bacterium]
RMGNMCVFSVDALGLRPLWFGQTEKEYFASSERGVYPLDVMSEDAKPLAPGEKIALKITPGYGIEVMDYPAIQRHVLNRYRARYGGSPLMEQQPQPDNNGGYPGNGSNGSGGTGLYHNGSNGSNNIADNRNGGQQSPSLQKQIAAIATQAVNGTVRQTQLAASIQVDSETIEVELEPQLIEEPIIETYDDVDTPNPWEADGMKLNDASLAALGWERYHPPLVEAMAERNKEAIGSLGWDGPLAAMSHTRSNLADYFKETVAVVTNPAIDREREQSQFSTNVVIGERPGVTTLNEQRREALYLETPFIPGGHPGLGDEALMSEIADELGTTTLQGLITYFGKAAQILSIAAKQDENIDVAIERLQQEAVTLVKQGAQCLILDDSSIFDGETHWIDPLLITAAIDKALRQADGEHNLRRQTGIILRSGSLRDLHDIALCLSMGANAIVPYAMYAIAIGIAPRGGKTTPEPDFIKQRITAMMNAARKGIEKIIATIGCHDLRGYGHSFSSIGLAHGVAKILGT